MLKKLWLLILLAALITLEGCVRTTPVAPAGSDPIQSPDGKQPTPTATRLTPLLDLEVFVGGHGWASNADRTIFYNTRDFGENWFNVTPEGFSAQGAGWGFTTAFPNGDAGWICQTESEFTSKLYTTIDGGRNWQTLTLEFPCGLISLINTDEGYILSDMGVGAGSQYVSIYYTSNGGQTWDLRFEHEPADSDDHGLPTSGTKSHFVFLSVNNGLVGGSAPIPGSVYLYRTKDGGVSWFQSECEGLPVDENQETSVEDIIRIDSNSAILPVRSYLADGSTATYFCSSTDAGESWQYIGMLENVEFFDFGSLLTGVAFGDGKMFQTEDGGATWTDTSVGLPPAVMPVAVNMMNDRVGFLTATITPATLTDNCIYMTGNNGDNWQSIPGNVIDSILINPTP